MTAARLRMALLGTALVLTALRAAQAARADTILHLSVTASVTAMPDELSAQLTATADASTAGAAQARVNQMVQQALGATKGVTAVTATTTRYSVWHETDPKDVWHASQGVGLRSRDGGGLLTLVGALQQDGLAVGDLGWQLSPAAAETSYEQAISKAVDLLTERAGAVARLLHLSLRGFRSVTVGEDSGPLAPMGLMRMTAATPAAVAAPPSAQAGVMTVSATVSGEARLVAAEP